MSSAGDKTKPRLISQKVDASYHVVITCDVEVDLSDPKLDVEFPLARVPFAGKWVLRLEHVDGAPRIVLHHGSLKHERIGSNVDMRISVRSLQDGVDEVLEAACWTDNALPDVGNSGVAHEYLYHRLDEEAQPAQWRGRKRYRFVWTCEQYTKGFNVPSSACAELARRLSDIHLEQFPSQLRLFFPDVGKDGAELWVSSDLLVKSAPYFKDLLSSDFSEATPRRSKRARKSGAQPLPVPATGDKEFDDSDDETDAFLLKKKPPKLSESTEAYEHSFREITITQTSFSTYHALLVYLESGYIRFAPLRSASSPSNPSASSSRDDFLCQQLHDDPCLPLPVSPKSMFRLADLLRLSEEDPLSSLCLRAFSDPLSHHGAAIELFSDTSVCFDKIRKIVLEYVVKNWDAVCETASWKEMMERIKRDEVAGAGGVMVELMQAREEAARKKHEVERLFSLLAFSPRG